MKMSNGVLGAGGQSWTLSAKKSENRVTVTITKDSIVGVSLSVARVGMYSPHFHHSGAMPSVLAAASCCASALAAALIAVCVMDFARVVSRIVAASLTSLFRWAAVGCLVGRCEMRVDSSSSWRSAFAWSRVAFSCLRRVVAAIVVSFAHCCLCVPVAFVFACPAASCRSWRRFSACRAISALAAGGSVAPGALAASGCIAAASAL